jgi:hypothetical protein
MRLTAVAITGIVMFQVVAASGRAADNKLPAEAVTILTKPDQFELLSLDPAPDKKDTTKDGFHDYKVLGKTQVKDADTRKELFTSLTKGMERVDKFAACFNPRHGIRATRDGKTVELVICFECHQLFVYLGTEIQPGLLVNHSPEPAFDKVLKDAGIPKAK